MAIRPEDEFMKTTREEVVQQAIKTINGLPKHQLIELKEGFDRAEEYARRILRGSPGQ